MQDWRAAVAVFRSKSVQLKPKGSADRPPVDSESVRHAAEELERFMSGVHGRTAMELLEASNRHIVFSRTSVGDGMGIVVFLDGLGFQSSMEAMGSWVPYVRDVPRPRVSSVTIRHAVESAITFGDKKPAELMAWLRNELDQIAASSHPV